MPNTLAIGKCPYCDNFIFVSIAEKERHINVLHRDKKGKYTKLYIDIIFL